MRRTGVALGVAVVMIAGLSSVTGAMEMEFVPAFPLEGLNPLSPSLINSVFDRSIESGAYKSDGSVHAYSDEVGRRIFGGENDGCYKKDLVGSEFELNGNYRGALGRHLLCYDGHPGVDFKVEGVRVLAVEAGEVVELKDDAPDEPDLACSCLGNFIKIEHRNGFISVYGHLKRNSLRKGNAELQRGDEVTRGEVIALSGNSGASSGPHLHFELRRPTANGVVPVDPYSFWVRLLARGLAGPANGLVFRPNTNDLLVTEFGADRVSRIDASTGTVSFFASVSDPDEMVVNSKGEVFVKTHRAGGPISRFDANGNFLGSFTPFSGFPTGMAFDAYDNLYVADSTTGTIWKFTAGTFSSPTVFAGGFPSLEGIAFSPSGQLFATDFVNGRIYEVIQGGTTLTSHTLWATGLSVPLNFAFDPTSGDIFVSNSETIVRISAPGAVSRFAGGFTSGFGLGSYDLDFDSRGNLYVDDFTKGYVWKFFLPAFSAQ